MIRKIILLPFTLVGLVVKLGLGVIKNVIGIISSIIGFFTGRVFGAFFGAIIGFLLGRKGVGIKLFSSKRNNKE